MIKQRLLELLGYNLVSVPYWEWEEMRQDKRAQEAYLRNRLERPDKRGRNAASNMPVVT